jgi:hypothetical protein
MWQIHHGISEGCNEAGLGRIGKTKQQGSRDYHLEDEETAGAMWTVTENEQEVFLPFPHTQSPLSLLLLQTYEEPGSGKRVPAPASQITDQGETIVLVTKATQFKK